MVSESCSNKCINSTLLLSSLETIFTQNYVTWTLPPRFLNKLGPIHCHLYYPKTASLLAIGSEVAHPRSPSPQVTSLSTCHAQNSPKWRESLLHGGQRVASSHAMASSSSSFSPPSFFFTSFPFFFSSFLLQPASLFKPFIFLTFDDVIPSSFLPLASLSAQACPVLIGSLEPVLLFPFCMTCANPSVLIGSLEPLLSLHSPFSSFSFCAFHLPEFAFFLTGLLKPIFLFLLA